LTTLDKKSVSSVQITLQQVVLGGCRCRLPWKDESWWWG